MRTMLLAALLLAVLAATAHGLGSRSIAHLEPVLGAKLTWATENESARARRSAQNQPNPDNLHIAFTAFGRDFEFDLEIVREIVADSKVIVYGENDKIIKEYKPQNTVYRAMLDDGWVNLNLHENGLFFALLNLNGELFTIEPLHLHAREMDSKTRRSLADVSDLVMYRDADLINENEKLCGVAQPVHRRSDASDVSEGPINATYHPQGKMDRKLLTVAKWTSCYPNDATPRRFKVAFVTDVGYYNVFGSSTAVSQSILDILSSSNIIYLTQVNVFLSLGTVAIRSTTSTDTWNQAPTTPGQRSCAIDIDPTLTAFKTWRKAQTSDTDGTFHLLTNCYPPSGTVGLAYVGVLCDKNNGAGVSSYSASTWKTVAHEVGHNFGANHAFQEGQGTTGGIMDYGDGTLNGEYQFNSKYNKDEVCAEIASSMSATGTSVVKTCWTNYAPTCGNGIIEGTEQCDDTSSCCVNCKFVTGGYCSSGPCCTPTCQFAPTTVNCGPSVDLGFCSNGKCVQSPCSSYSNLDFCGVSATNPCQQTCTINGGTACNLLTSYNLNGTVPDGIVCKTSPYGLCKTGKCVNATAPTNVPTVPPTAAPTLQPSSSASSTPSIFLALGFLAFLLASLL